MHSKTRKITYNDYKNFKKCPMMFYYDKSTNYHKKFIFIEDWFDIIMKKTIYSSLFHNLYDVTALKLKFKSFFKFKEQNVINPHNKDYFEIGMKSIENYVAYMKQFLGYGYPVIFKAFPFDVGIKQGVMYEDSFDLVYNYTQFDVPMVVNFEFNKPEEEIYERLSLTMLGYTKIYGEKALFKAINFYENGKIISRTMKTTDMDIRVRQGELDGVIEGIRHSIFFTSYNSLCKITCPFYQHCYVSSIELNTDKYVI